MHRLSRHFKNVDTKRLILGFLASLSLFLILKLFFRFPFITDDYWYLSNFEKGRSDLSLFGNYLARVPLWCLGTWAIFHSGIVYWENTAYAPVFAGNTLFLMLFARELKAKIFSNSRISWVFVLLCGIFAFFPNDHEVLFWPTDWAYFGGLPFLYWGWKQERIWFKVLLYTLAFNFGEMFLLPALALELIPCLFASSEQPDFWDVRAWRNHPLQRQEQIRLLLSKILLWCSSVLLFLMIRRGLSMEFGAYTNKAAFSPLLFPRQLMNMFNHFFVMSFYKDFWPPTLLYWLGAILIVKEGRKRQLLSKRYLFPGMLFILVCGSLVFVMGYFAPRALYGASVCVNAMLIVLLERSLSEANLRLKAASLTIMALGFFGQTLLMFDLKNSNSLIMQGKEIALVKQMEECQEPCRISVDSIPQGLKRGWVMHADYAKPFGEWVKLRHQITKQVEFVQSSQTLDLSTR